MNSEIIAAVSTGAARTAIGILRLSGAGCIELIDRVFRAANGGAMAVAEPRKLVYGGLYDETGAIIDDCLCTVSRGPFSYTGEDTAELQCHGSPIALAAGLGLLFRQGARQAMAGEFTRRAFLNGRMDLTQAEAVVDLIDAETEEAALNAASQLAGAVFRIAEGVYQELAGVCAHFLAIIDYPEEDIPDFDLGGCSETLRAAEVTLTRLLAGQRRGGALTEGVAAAIIGRPNVGKSSLLNALLGYDRAIVTAAPGTTRDTVSERLRLGGVLLRLTDTAGLRVSEDPAESLGIARSREAAAGAAVVFALFDGSEPLSAADAETIAAAQAAENVVAVISKSDLPQLLDTAEIRGRFGQVCAVSAVSGEGLDGLEAAVAEIFPMPEGLAAGELLTNARQAGVVARALEAVKAAREAVEAGVTPDAALSDVEAAMGALAELTGRSVTEDVAAEIFSRFCVGK